MLKKKLNPEMFNYMTEYECDKKEMEFLRSFIKVMEDYEDVYKLHSYFMYMEPYYNQAIKRLRHLEARYE